MAVEIFSANLATTTVSSGGTDAPSSGTSQSWTVISSTGFPAASSGASPQTQFHIADPAQPSEMLAVTNVSGTTWTVTRGAEGTTPVSHTGGFTVYQVVTAGGLGSFLKAGNNLSDVGSLAATRANLGIDTLTPSGDVTGATDAAAIMTAVAALPTQGGIVTLDASGVWYIECGVVVVNRSGVYINAPGCYISGVGAGDVFRMYDSSDYLTRTYNGGGILGFPTINGNNTTGDSSGIHFGDILQGGLEVQSQYFTSGTTSKCVWLDNQWWFTEQLWGRIFTQNGTSLVVFDNSTGTATSVNATQSFDRFGADIFLENGGIGNGVVFSNGAFIINPDKMGVFGNFNSSSTAVYSVFVFDNAISEIAYGSLYVGVELDTSDTHTPTTFSFDNSGFTGIHNCTGLMDFGSGSEQFAASNNDGNFVFDGDVFGDSSLSAMQFLSRPGNAQGSFEDGQTFFTGSNGWVFTGSSTSYTGDILQAGNYDNQTVTIKNAGSGSLSFAGSATSNVASGTAAVIAGYSSATFVWDATTSLWYTPAEGGGSGGGGGGSGTAIALATTSTPVIVSTATAPSSGQVLTATSGTSATWQSPAGGGGGTAFYSLTSGTAFTATSATSAGTAFYALNSGTAFHAGTAFASLTSGTASYSLTSGTAFSATSAISAGTAFYATNAGTAFWAGTAYAAVISSGTAFYSLTSGTAYTASTSTATYGLESATTTVFVSASTAPSTGQVLTATSSTAANWQTPSGGGGGTAFYATTSGTAFAALTSGTASYSLTAGTASYALTAGTAFLGTSALTAGTAFYATSAGTAYHGGTAFFATTSGNFSSGATLPDYVAPAVVGLSFGGSIVVNAASGNAYNLTLTSNVGTITTPTNPVDGQVIRFRITQGTGGTFTTVWGAGYDFGAVGTSPTLSTTAARVDIVAFEYVASISKWACLGSGIGY